MKAVEIIRIEPTAILPLPYSEANVAAGFPSPADDYSERTLDLNEHLIANPASTFYIRVQGDSMVDENIHSGDILIVDKSLEARPGDVVIAEVDGEFCVKKLGGTKGAYRLIPANPDFPEIPLLEESTLWGVVTHSIKGHRK